MKELFMNYSLSEIFLFIISLAAAIKGFVSFYDWGMGRLKQNFSKDFQEQISEKRVTERLDKHDKQLESVLSALDKNNQMISLLIASDKDDIKAWITEKHHYFCYEKRVIDDYSLDCLEKRFNHYQDEGGNSYAETLMNEMRALPKVSVIREEEEKKGE